MNREQLLRRIDREWQGLAQACQGMSEEVLLQPGVVGEWSIKDLLGHVATWEKESMTALGLIMQGKQPARYSSYGGIDAFNEHQWQLQRTMPLEETHRQFLETHERLLTFLNAVPQHHYMTETRFRRRLRVDTYRHYTEHRRQVVAWRQAKGR